MSLYKSSSDACSGLQRGSQEAQAAKMPRTICLLPLPETHNSFASNTTTTSNTSIQVMIVRRALFHTSYPLTLWHSRACCDRTVLCHTQHRSISGLFLVYFRFQTRRGIRPGGTAVALAIDPSGQPRKLGLSCTHQEVDILRLPGNLLPRNGGSYAEISITRSPSLEALADRPMADNRRSSWWYKRVYPNTVAESGVVEAY